MTEPKTLRDKIWDEHEILKDDDGQSLLLVARHLAHDGSYHAFSFLKKRGMRPRRPDQTFATPTTASQLSATGSRTSPIPTSAGSSTA